MRAIAEEGFALVREYKGSHSGEHGDGIVRSEFHDRCSAGDRRAFEEVKERSIRTGCSTPAGSCARRGSTTGAISVTGRAMRRGDHPELDWSA